jgi:hypothetical protein
MESKPRASFRFIGNMSLPYSTNELLLKCPTCVHKFVLTQDRKMLTALVTAAIDFLGYPSWGFFNFTFIILAMKSNSNVHWMPYVVVF